MRNLAHLALAVAFAVVLAGGANAQSLRIHHRPVSLWPSHPVVASGLLLVYFEKTVSRKEATRTIVEAGYRVAKTRAYDAAQVLVVRVRAGAETSAMRLLLDNEAVRHVERKLHRCHRA